MSICQSLAAAAILLSWTPAYTQTALRHVSEADVRLHAKDTHFVLDLPVEAGQGSGEARVEADLVDTQNLVRSHGSAPCALHPGHNRCTVELPPANGANTSDTNLPLFRVRYRVAAVAQPVVSGALALEGIAPELCTLHAALPAHVRPGAPYSVRVRAVHP